MRCRDHEREPCAVPRCQVLARCYADLRDRASLEDTHELWCKRQGYSPWPSMRQWVDGPHLGHVQRAVAEQVAARLVAWMRWPGDVACMACGGTGEIRRDRCPLCRGAGARPGWHQLDPCATHEQRIHALSTTCPVCCGSGWHPVHGPVQHELLADCSYQPTAEGIAFRALHLPCDHDGTDWATVLVLLDWLHDRGWTFQEVHEWRPRAIATDPLDQLAGAFAMPAAALSGAYHDAAAIDQEWHRIAVLLGGPASLLDAVRAGIQEYALRSPHPLLEVYRFAAEHIAARGELAAMWWASQREVVARPGSAEWYRTELAVLLANFHYAVDFAPGRVTVRIRDSRPMARLQEWLPSCPITDHVEIVIDGAVGPSARVRGV